MSGAPLTLVVGPALISLPDNSTGLIVATPISAGDDGGDANQFQANITVTGPFGAASGGGMTILSGCGWRIAGNTGGASFGLTATTLTVAYVTRDFTADLRFVLGLCSVCADSWRLWLWVWVWVCSGEFIVKSFDLSNTSTAVVNLRITESMIVSGPTAHLRVALASAPRGKFVLSSPSPTPTPTPTPIEISNGARVSIDGGTLFFAGDNGDGSSTGSSTSISVTNAVVHVADDVLSATNEQLAALTGAVGSSLILNAGGVVSINSTRVNTGTGNGLMHVSSSYGCVVVPELVMFLGWWYI